MRALNIDNFNAVATSTDGLFLNSFLARLQEYFASASVVESLKKMPGDFKVIVAVNPKGHGSTEAHMLSAVRQEMEENANMSIDFEKVDGHHFIVHFVHQLNDEHSRIHPVHRTLDESDLDQYVTSQPVEDMVVSVDELDLSDEDNSDLDVYTVNEPLIEVSDTHYTGTISDKSYLHTFDDLVTNYKLVQPQIAQQYTQVHKELTPDERFELWSNMNGIISVVKDNLTNKYWELKS